MKNSRYYKERERTITKRMFTFVFMVCISMVVIIASNIAEGEKFISEAEAHDRGDVEVEAVFAYPDGYTPPEPPKELTIEERIIEACDKYDIPSDIPMAIARLETGHFKSKAYTSYHNPGGMCRNGKPIKYESIEEGVEAFIGNLAKNYFAKGLTTPETIGKKYCPVNYDHWVKLVKQLM